MSCSRMNTRKRASVSAHTNSSEAPETLRHHRPPLSSLSFFLPRARQALGCFIHKYHCKTACYRTREKFVLSFATAAAARAFVSFSLLLLRLLPLHYRHHHHRRRHRDVVHTSGPDASLFWYVPCETARTLEKRTHACARVRVLSHT